MDWLITHKEIVPLILFALGFLCLQKYLKELQALPKDRLVIPEVVMIVLRHAVLWKWVSLLGAIGCLHVLVVNYSVSTLTFIITLVGCFTILNIMALAIVRVKQASRALNGAWETSSHREGNPGGPTFVLCSINSEDGKREVHVLSDGQMQWVAVDGKELQKYDAIGQRPLFSLDSRRIAYVAKRGRKELVVVDGRESREYDAVPESYLVFSPDSRRIGYPAREGGRMFVVVDGSEGPRYRHIHKGSPLFSPNSQRVAYVGHRFWKSSVVVDGQEQKRYRIVIGESVKFSPNSRRIAYIASISIRKGSLVVVDGSEYGPYEGVMRDHPFFSKDSRSFAYIAKRGNIFIVVVNGEERKRLHREPRHCETYAQILNLL